ncbi:MAG: leucine-rich repeat domain-containing protein [Clostridia bacterium]|nr:leucine-rich repeat domain-containing protein [Clostridia bacterium]
MNKTISKILSLILSVMVTVGMVNLGAFKIKAEALTYGDFEYQIYFDEYASITKYNGTDEVVEIPSVIGNKPVEAIAKHAFENNKTISEVTIPPSVKTIQSDAFNNCSSLKTVNLSEGLEALYPAFEFTAIESVTIPSTVRFMYINAFTNGCVKEIIFDASYTKECHIAELGTNWYDENTELVFKGLPDVQIDLELRNANYVFYMKDGNYCYRPDYKNTTVPEIFTCGDYKYTLDSGEATIVRYNNFDAEEVIVPQTLDGYPVTTIGEFAFSSASEVGKSFVDTTISYTYNFKKITVPAGVKSVERYAFAENESLVEVVLPDGLTNFGYCAFMFCGNLEKINIPSGTEVLPDNFLFASPNMRTTLPDSLKIVANEAIHITTYDRDYTDNPDFNAVLPDSVEFLGEDLFSGCCYVAELSLPQSLQEMHGTFRAMTDLKRINFNDSLHIIGDYTFVDCVNLEETIIPDSVTQIGENAFDGCEKLSKVYMSENVKCVPYRAFYDCVSLNYFSWNSDEKTIGKDAFYGCPLNGFDFSNSYGIDDGAFYGSSIESAKIGKGDYETDEKQTIGAQSFMCCSELQTVSLGGNVTEVGSQAFAECENLETVVIADSVEKIADDAFDGSEKVTIYCWEDSYAQAYATEQKIKVTTLVIDPIPNQTYTTKEIKPALTVSMSSQKLDNSDYTADFYNNVNIGTASVVVAGKGDFDMLISKADFAIVAKNIADVQFSSIPAQTYEDSAITPEVSLNYNGTNLQEGKDYTITYENNNSVGTGTVRIKGIGNYKGTVTINFEIREPSVPQKIINIIADSFSSFFAKILTFFNSIFR